MVGVFLVAAVVTLAGRAAVAAAGPGALERAGRSARRSRRSRRSRDDAAACGGVSSRHGERRDALAAADPGDPRVVAEIRASLVADRHAPVASRDDLAAALADPEARLWVDVTAPAHVEVDDIGAAAQPPPADRRGHRGAQPAGQDRGDRGHLPHRAVRDRLRGRVTEVEVDLVLNHRSLLTVHEPGWDPLQLPQLRGDPAALLKRGPGLPAVRPHRRPSSTATSRCSTRSRTRSTPSRTTSSRTPNSWTLQRLFSLKRQLIGAAPRDEPGPRGVQPAHQPRPPADRPRARRLLPRRLRPPDPGHRRARQRPRARGGHARGLPVDGQQQPRRRS